MCHLIVVPDSCREHVTVDPILSALKGLGGSVVDNVLSAGVDGFEEGRIRLPPEPVRADLPIDDSDSSADRPSKLRAIGTADVTVFRSRRGVYVVVAEARVEAPNLRGQTWNMRYWLDLVDRGGLRIENVGPMDRVEWHSAIGMAAAASSKSHYRDTDLSLSSICWHRYGRIAAAVDERTRIEGTRSLIERHPVPRPTEFGMSVIWSDPTDGDDWPGSFYFDGDLLPEMTSRENGQDPKTDIQKVSFEEICDVAIDRFVVTALDRELISMRASLTTSDVQTEMESDILQKLDRMAARLREVRHPTRSGQLREHLDGRLGITRDAESVADDLTLMSESVASRISLRIARGVTELDVRIHGLREDVEVLQASVGPLESVILKSIASRRAESSRIAAQMRRTFWIQCIAITISLAVISIGVLIGSVWQFLTFCTIVWTMSLVYFCRGSEDEQPN